MPQSIQGRLKSAYNRTGTSGEPVVRSSEEDGVTDNKLFSVTCLPTSKDTGEGCALVFDTGDLNSKIVRIRYSFHNEKVQFQLIRNPTLVGDDPRTKCWFNDAAVVAGEVPDNITARRVEDITGVTVGAGVILDDFTLVGEDSGGAARPFVDGVIEANKVLAPNTTYAMVFKFLGTTTGELHVNMVLLDSI